MIEKIRENIFRITVPMPNNPLKYLNAYVLTGAERTCLIDTGLNRDSCWQAWTDCGIWTSPWSCLDTGVFLPTTCKGLRKSKNITSSVWKRSNT